MQNITVEELKGRMDAGEKVNLIDVREPDENAAFNIGGTLLPLGQIQSMQIDDIEDLKEEELVLYCRSGNRSGAEPGRRLGPHRPDRIDWGRTQLPVCGPNREADHRPNLRAPGPGRD